MSIAEPGALEAKEIEADLLELWKGIVDSVAKESPQNRAFLTLTKPLGLFKFLLARSKHGVGLFTHGL